MPTTRKRAINENSSTLLCSVKHLLKRYLWGLGTFIAGVISTDNPGNCQHRWNRGNVLSAVHLANGSSQIGLVGRGLRVARLAAVALVVLTLAVFLPMLPAYVSALEDSERQTMTVRKYDREYPVCLR
jgi:hypothetical protein